MLLEVAAGIVLLHLGLYSYQIYFYPSIRNKEYFEPFLTNSIYTLSIGVKNIGILESQSIFECINVRIF